MTTDNFDSTERPLVYLASYPKSGNTFIRILLCNYLFSDGDGFSINKLSEKIPSENSQLLWNHLVPELPETAPADAQWRARPKLFARYRQSLEPSFLAIKTHSANLTAMESPAFQFKPGDKAVYIVRHPLDVALSYADFNGHELDEAIDLMVKSGTLVSLPGRGVFDLRASWRENVLSWLCSDSVPVLLLRYEDLRDQTANCLRQILTFLDIPVDEKRLAQTVEHSSLSKVKKQEEEEGFTEAPDHTTSGRFFRTGKSGEWREKMSLDQACRVTDPIADLLPVLGYNHPREILSEGKSLYTPIKSIDPETLKLPLAPLISNAITFLASYPRSGNTFARILLSNYMADGDEPFDLALLQKVIPADTSEDLWGKLADYASKEISTENNRLLRAKVIAAYRRSPTDWPLRALKTHAANLKAFGQMPFDFEPQDRIIHLVRNPLDVALSLADFNDQSIEATVGLMCNSGTCVGSGTLASIEVRGSWSENVEGWLKRQVCPTLLVRYEDLCENTEETLRKMVEFVGLPLDESRLKQAVERSRFSVLREEEEKNGFAEAPAKTTSNRFFRKGRSGQWKTELGKKEADRIIENCAGTMLKLGYHW